jgi:hypothetical protein
MAKINVNRSINPLPNEYRNSDSISEAERDAIYAQKASADNPQITVGPTVNRGANDGMVPIRDKNNR